MPKLLGVLRKSWAPHAFVVSFKLETDPNILLEKAYRALDNYDVHFVVANLLNTRREECILVSKGMCESDVCLPADSYSKIKITRGTVPNLEANLIETIEKAHVQFMLREYGVFSNQNSRTKQAALEVEVMRGVARALEDPIAITVRSYTTLADKMWSELDTWDHKNDSCAESVHQEDRDGSLAVLVGNVGLSALVMAAVAWAANTCRK